jgi:hypothetical protein
VVPSRNIYRKLIQRYNFVISTLKKRNKINMHAMRLNFEEVLREKLEGIELERKFYEETRV